MVEREPLDQLRFGRQPIRGESKMKTRPGIAEKSVSRIPHGTRTTLFVLVPHSFQLLATFVLGDLATTFLFDVAHEMWFLERVMSFD